LRTHLPPVKSQDGDILQNHLQASLDHVDSVESEEGREAIEEFWEKAVESKCEGLMIKAGDMQI
jgi:DNA ligase-1